MTEEQEHYCEVETIKCPHYPTLLVLSLETGASPADILAAVNRRRPQFGGFLICTGRGSDGTAKATAAITAEELRRASELIAAVPELSAPTSVRIGAEGNAVRTDIGGNGWLLSLTVTGAEGKCSGGAK